MYPYIAVGISGSGPQSRFTPNSLSFLDGADAAPLLLVSVVVVVSPARLSTEIMARKRRLPAGIIFLD
jgi:hypothetical protein